MLKNFRNVENTGVLFNYLFFIVKCVIIRLQLLKNVVYKRHLLKRIHIFFSMLLCQLEERQLRPYRLWSVISLEMQEVHTLLVR